MLRNAEEMLRLRITFKGTTAPINPSATSRILLFGSTWLDGKWLGQGMNKVKDTRSY